MSLLDGQVGKQSPVDVFLDKLDLDRLFRMALSVFIASVLLTPVIVYFSFAYFTAKAAPWWLDAMTGVNIGAFLLSGLAIFVLGIVKLIASRED